MKNRINVKELKSYNPVGINDIIVVISSYDEYGLTLQNNNFIFQALQISCY